jgi:hypothetical protein
MVNKKYINYSCGFIYILSCIFILVGLLQIPPKPGYTQGTTIRTLTPQQIDDQYRIDVLNSTCFILIMSGLGMLFVCGPTHLCIHVFAFNTNNRIEPKHKDVSVQTDSVNILISSLKQSSEKRVRISEIN